MGWQRLYYQMNRNTKIALGILGAIGLIGIIGYVNRKAIKKVVKKTVYKAKKFLLKKQHEYFVEDLHPKVQDRFRELIRGIEKRGYDVILTSGYRSFKKQADLKKKNPKNASPGRSMHNYGLAIDLNLRKGTTLWRKKTSQEKWLMTGVPQLAEKLGFRWGGRFKSYHDPVHFSLAKDYSPKKLLAQAVKQFGSKPEKIRGNRVVLTA